MDRTFARVQRALTPEQASRVLATWLLIDSVRDFVIGTMIGMLPGIIALAIFAEGLLSLVSQANLRAVALILVGVLGLAGLAWAGKRLNGYRQ